MHVKKEQIGLIEAGISELMNTKDAVAALFCERLFVHDPALRSVFGQATWTLDGQWLEPGLAMLLAGLRDPRAADPALAGLARLYPAQCINPALHETVRKAWIETLALAFGPRLTRDQRLAWNEACRDVSGMLRASQPGQLRPE